MNDFNLFDTYRKENTHPNGNAKYCSVEHLLRFWRENKGKYLMPLFGDKLILEREVSYNKSEDELHDDMNRMLHEHWSFVERLTDRLHDVMKVEDGWSYEDNVNTVVWRNLRNQIMNAHQLNENVLSLGYTDYTSEGPDWIKSYTIEFEDDSKVQLQKGMKLTRAFTQIAKHMGMEEGWEKFRIAHSQVLNTKKLTGTMCLSIHPLDYATASDNDNGWSSCMSWREEGCYRMGTVEMMNSPMVICAYLKSKKQAMMIDGQEWNSKKWRAWIIVTKDAIICNRHYPYHNADFATQCIEWVRDMVGAQYGWKYDEIHTDFYDYMRENDWDLEYYTNYMYNDLGGEDVIGCVNEGHRDLHKSILFSGPAECMVCGDEIMPDHQGADQLECDECFRSCTCECGRPVDEEDCYRDPDGNPMCEDCWERYCRECAICGETIWKDDAVEIRMPIHTADTDEWVAKFANDVDGFVRRLKHCYETTEPVYVCEYCSRRHNIVSMVYDRDNIDTGVEIRGTYMIPDPTKMSMEEAFDLIHPDDYEYARSRLDMDKRDHPWAHLNDDEKAYFQLIIDYWTHQWELLKADYEKKYEGGE